MKTFKYFATCARGLEPVLFQEVQHLKADNICQKDCGVSFEGDLKILYKANLCLRTAIRILRVELETEIRSDSELYQMVRSIDWSQYTNEDQTISVDSNVWDSFLTHSMFASQRVKDAVCDQFVDKTGRRPSVDRVNPQLKINFHLHNNKAVISLDSSGDSLHKRGYRPKQWKAPINESLASGLIILSGWEKNKLFWDPMCGSGTIPIEAAMIATGRAPGLTRKRFGFQAWTDYNASTFLKMRDELRGCSTKNAECQIFGSDSRSDSFHACKETAGAAGVGHVIRFFQEDFTDIDPSKYSPGLLLMNPPYGVRVGDAREMPRLYREIGGIFRERFSGWSLAMLTGYPHALNELKMNPEKNIRLFNGPIPCKFLVFRNGN